MVTEENQGQITQIVLRIAYPAIILSGAFTDEPHISNQQLLNTFGIVILLLVLLIIASWVLPLILGYKKYQYGVVRAMNMFSNIGFMGVLLIAAIYGSGALIYMTVFLIPFNILFFSLGMKLVRGDGSGSPMRWRDLLSEGMISCFLALFIYLFNIPIPYVIKESVQLLGNMTAPLAMLLIGAFLADLNLKELFTDVRTWLFTLMKMIVIPVIITMVLRYFTDNTELLAVCLAAVATPAGNVIPLLAALYNKKAYPVSLAGIALTTLVSVVTMPLVYWMTGLA